MMQVWTFSSARPGDTDTYILDCRTSMAARGDQITSATLISVARVDGVTIGSQDLVVTNVGVIPAGTTINFPPPTPPVVATAGTFTSFSAAGGQVGVVYIVTVQLTLLSGVVLNPECTIPVTALIV